MIRVVVADDHPAFLLGLRLGLEEAGLDVVGAAHDGDEALELLFALRPEAAVLDIRMPGRSGLDVARRVLAEGLGTAVVVLTTYHDAATRREAFEAGVRAFLSKETDVTTVARVVERAVADPAWRAFEAPALPALTPRELDVLHALGRGLSNKAIARALDISPDTVKEYCSSIFGKLDVRDRLHAVAEARGLGLVADDVMP
jgi:two-component system, NarL family, nitrate/nitrite response regulator NarL